MPFLLPILSVFGAGLTKLFSWAVGWFMQKKANEAAAAQQMNSDLTQHANDGAISVHDSQSIEAQEADLNAQAAEIDAAASAKVEQPVVSPQLKK